ncbi:non-ribosomal peptide synthetase, partial [Chitinophaga varians]|uniref:non-ribosomal peptide synthetase n=1 Tax=Chitinophaga varians TaxID=2202339 RepID=UPI00165FD918
MMFYRPTVSQRLIWLDQAKSPGSAKYNIGGYAFLEGQFLYHAFYTTLKKIIDSQEAYCTFFQEVNYDLVCVVQDKRREYNIKFIDFSMEPDAESEAEKWMQNDFGIAFQVENNFLYNFTLLKISEEKYFWYAKIHHLISDGFSFKLLLNQAAEIYDACIQSGDHEEVNYAYSEYAAEDEIYYQSPSAQDDKKFWMDEFRELPAELLHKRAAGIKAHEETAGSDTLYLSRELKQILEDAAERHHVSVFNIILGILLIYFGRSREQQAVTFGIPVLNRTRKRYRFTAGVFMNLLALNFPLQEEDSFAAVVKAIKDKMSKALRHQRYQYGNLISDLQIPHDRTLFDIRVSYEDFSFTSDFGGLKTGAVALSNHAEIDKLAIYLRDYHDEGFDVRFVYNKAYFDKETIGSVKNSIRHMIASLASYEDQPVNSIDLLDAEERNKIIQLSAGPVKHRPQHSFLDMWKQVVETFPENICIACHTGSYNYQETNYWASKIARGLLNRDVRSGERIALLLPRSEKMVTGMLGAMMAGLIYIPLDPEYPEERIRYILQHAHCACLLTSQEIGNPGSQVEGVKRLYIEDLLNDSAITKGDNRHVAVDDDQPCYIIYTSGSTGKPKGVSIAHRSLLDYVCTFQEYFRLKEEDVMVQLASVSFDTSVEEIFPILGVGGRLNIWKDRKDIFGLADFIGEEAVTILSSNPLTIKYLNTLALPESLRIVISGGDVLKMDYVDNLIRDGIKVFNTYGPTESTVCATYYPVTRDTGVMPIGKPITNREVFILNSRLQLQPLGVEGEICIGGAGLALEYVGDAQQTARSFVPHVLQEGKKMYRTGDAGILMPDGNIIFKGRKDNQLKYRGYRIEAEEVERVIIERGKVNNCVVCVSEFRNDPVLIAYVEVDYLTEDLSYLLKKKIAAWLPSYMVPEVIVVMDSFPMLVSGKVDKKSLPVIQPEMFRTEKTEKVAPQTALEKQLYSIWTELLPSGSFGTTDSFFDLGGHSLLAMQLLNYYFQSLEVKLSLKELFECPTIRQQAVLIEGKATEQYKRIAAIAPAADYPVSYGQRRLWVLSQFENISRAYHLSGYAQLEGHYEPSCLQQAIQHVIDRHEILRTVFYENEAGELRQSVIPAGELMFRLTDAGTEMPTLSEAAAYIRASSTAAFDLAKAPLFRAGLIRVQPDLYVFYYHMHHIISDGWSMELLAREVMEAYAIFEKGQLPPSLPLRIQYKDYAVWQQDQLAGDTFKTIRAYWLEQISGELPVLTVPTARQRPPVMTQHGFELAGVIPKETVEKLLTLCRQHQATLFMGLYSVMNALLYRYTGQEDIIMGSPVAAREDRDLEDQIGFYVNTLAMRTRFSRKDSFYTLLGKVREVTLAAYNHQMYPFDRLIEDLHLRRDLSRNPVFDIMFTLQNRYDKRKAIAGSVSGEAIEEIGACTVKLDLNIEFTEDAAGLQMLLQFNTDIYNKEDMVRLMQHYRLLLASICADPESVMEELDYLPADESNKIITVFNDTAANWPATETIVTLLEQQVARTPEQTALVCGD